MNYRKIKLILSISLFIFSAFVLFFVVVYKFDLKEVQSLFSIIGSSSNSLALLTYLYKKKQDGLLATVDQITFFREKIIPEWDKLLKQIIQKHPQFVLSRISYQLLARFL